MSANPAHSDLVTLSPGDRLDGYLIAEQIGEGGTSVVWKATHTQTGQVVAVKQLLFTGSSEDDLVARRFRKEAKLLAELSQVHPRVVSVHQFIDDQRGAFLVMEYVAGQSLEDLLNESGDPIEPLRALKIVHAVANVLVAVHGRGVVHRDLKPSNLLLPDGGGVKVCDLGLAGLIAEQEALPVGSVRYMAPELFANKPATGAADIYALGMIAYEMFAGRAAYNEVFKTVLRDQRNQAMRWMKWHTNMRVSVPPLREVNPKIPPRLSELVARMMDKDIDRRVASAEELAEAIGRHFNKQRPADATGGARRKPSPPAAGNPVEKTAQLAHKRRWPLYVAAAVLLIGSGVGGYLILDKQAKEAAAIAAQTRQVAELIEEGGTRYQAGEFEGAFELFAAAEAAGPVGIDQADRARAGLLLAGARVDMAADKLDDAQRKLDELDRLNRPDIYSRDTIYALVAEVERREKFADDARSIGELIDRGQYDAARQRMTAYRGVVLRDEETAVLGDLAARLGASLGQAVISQALTESRRLSDMGQTDRAIASLEETIRRQPNPALTQELETLRRNARLTELRTAAQTADTAGNYAQAIEAYEQLQALSPDDAVETALGRLRAREATEEGKRLLARNDLAGAKAAFLRARGFHDDAEAAGYLARMEVEADLRSLIIAGDQAFGGGDYGAAVRHYTEAVEAGGGNDARQKLTRARVRQELARAEQAFAAGDLDRAQSAYRAALSLDGQAPGAEAGLERIDTRRRHDAEMDRGDQFRAAGRYADARRAYTRARGILDTDQVRQRLNDTEYEALVAQGRAYIEYEQWNAARASLRNAASLRPTDEVRELLELISTKEPRGQTQ